MLRKLIIAFWVFIGVMLLWQFMDYNASIDRKIDEKPAQKQFFFFNTNTPGAISSAPRVAGADLRQMSFEVSEDVPGKGQFTCRITVKNVGDTKATNIQVHIRPYRGITIGDEDNGHSMSGTLSDTDPAAQFGKWISLPDLPPGESTTQTVVFFGLPDIHPGSNPKPDFVFTKEKPAPAP